MRVILEGACGVGKSTLAKALSDITGVPVYRPFRGTDEHIPTSRIMAMQDLGLSVNGWEEDLYVADMLSVVNADVILDRSMPSALAYNAVMSTRALEASQRTTIVRLWAERIVAARAVLVYVTCPEETRKQRCPDRGGEWETTGIICAMQELAMAAPQPGFDIWNVNTARSTPEETARALARRIISKARSPLIESMAERNSPFSWQGRLR